MNDRHPVSTGRGTTPTRVVADVDDQQRRSVEGVSLREITFPTTTLPLSFR
jgi:hypothetical protein